MEMSEALSSVLVLAVLFLVVGVFIRVSIGLRRGGGSLTTTSLGATDGFLNKEKSKAAETIVNENAGKKFEAQQSAGQKTVDLVTGRNELSEGTRARDGTSLPAREARVSRHI